MHCSLSEQVARVGDGSQKVLGSLARSSDQA
ncbi:hypothetical protein A2U01_0112927, partial [Trifolium medium]|nr:hypothetical protein [Trifolium medium]